MDCTSDGVRPALSGQEPQGLQTIVVEGAITGNRAGHPDAQELSQVPVATDEQYLCVAKHSNTWILFESWHLHQIHLF